MRAGSRRRLCLLTALPVRVVRFSGASLRYGIEDAEFEGVPARITNTARTVVDCFRFRRVVGMDVALEAIRDVLDHRRVTPAQIQVCPKFSDRHLQCWGQVPPFNALTFQLDQSVRAGQSESRVRP